MQTLSPEQFKAKYGEQALQGFGSQPVQQPGYFQRVGQDIKNTAVGLGSDLQKQAQDIQDNPTAVSYAKNLGESALRGTGAFARGVFAPVMEAPGIKQATEFVGQKLAQTTPMQKFQEWAGRHPEAAKDIMDVLDVASLFGGKEVSAPIAKAGETLARDISTGIGDTGSKLVQKIPGAIEKGKTMFEPPAPKPAEAVGQVLQGKSTDIKAGVRALKEIDTSGVKTYNDLLNKTGESIKGLSQEVDKTLDNKKLIKLNDLKLSGKTKAGQTVKVDYVGRALEHLKEFYKSSGDEISAKNTEDLLKKSKTEGLTRLEVNNIARTYGIEFGEKAFGKTGEPLTSVSAQKFENTRKYLKEVARQGLPGEKAKALDKSISSLYRVQKLVKQNAEAVNKLNQKIQERGLLEKIGYGVAKGADLLTGGGIRGIVGGLLPRGVGYKVMNALDIEKALSRNLEVIQKALKTSDPELVKFLKTAPKQ